jgi:hypothetical protein
MRWALVIAACLAVLILADAAWRAAQTGAGCG